MRVRTSLRLWVAMAVFVSLARLASSFELPDPHLHHGTDKKDREDIAAVRYLGTVDCFWYPESQDVLLDTLKADPREPVRYAAAQALFDQFQRGRKPLKPLHGKREFPDPFILTQIAHVAHFYEPLSTEELVEMYAERKMERELKKHPERGDVQCGCSADKAIPVLSWVESGKDECDCFNEPSERVRKVASEMLQLLKPEKDMYLEKLRIPQPKPMPGMPPKTPQEEEKEKEIKELRERLESLDRRSEAGGSLSQKYGIMLGRADTANRFNVMDNMGALPRSRVFGGYQFVQSQNNAVFGSANLDELFSVLGSASGQAAFINFTGFGSGLAGQPTVTPDGTEASQKELRRLFTTANSGTESTEKFLLVPDSNLYRFGFEYALTPDFSFAMQGQYVAPIGDTEQPADFTNPLIQLKHVLYRDDLTVISGVLGISPEIPHRKAAIQELTTRFNPGVLFFRQFADDDRWLLQGGTGFSIPSKDDQIMTWDYGLSIGRFVYRHESLLTGKESDQFLLGVIPMLEVLGKEIIGDNTVRGAFGLNSAAPQTAPGTVSPVDGSRSIYLPQDPSRSFDQATFIYNEPRHVVDLTVGTSFILSHNRTFNVGLSFPVTGGSARALEFLTSFNWGF